MNVDIIVELRDDKLIFYLDLPFDLLDFDEEFISSLRFSPIYESSDPKINLNELSNKINNILDSINKRFYNGKIKQINLKFFIGEISNDDSKLFEFIKSNKNLDIVISGDKYSDVIDNLKNNKYDNLKVHIKTSMQTMPYEEFYYMYSKLYEIIKFIRHYKLSPLETVFLIYDIVKSNEYKAENPEEEYGVSRDLNQIINSGKMVCVGFSNLFNFICENVGIKSKQIKVSYDNKGYGHQRDCVYIKDDKYGIDGAFFLDSTWDGKKDKNYLDNYKYFLKSLSFFKKLSPDENPIIKNGFNYLLFSKSQLKNLIDNMSPEEEAELAVYLGSLYSFTKDKTIPFINLFGKSKEEILNIALDIFNIYNQKISKEAFKNALYKVRRIEYLNGILNYDIDEELLNDICDKYYGESIGTKLLKEIGLYDPSMEPSLDKDLEEINVSSLEEDLLRLKLLKLLKEQTNNEETPNFIKKM